jgi:membrane protease YdiL (CAAX protease family)
LISNNVARGMIMSFRQSIYGLGRSRRAVVLTPLIIALSAVLIWTLAHTDIAAFATVFVAGVILGFGTFWATGASEGYDGPQP